MQHRNFHSASGVAGSRTVRVLHLLRDKLAVLGVVVVVAAGACGNDQTADQSKTVDPSIDDSVTVETSTVGVAEQRLALDEAEKILLATAHGSVVAECLRSAGFDKAITDAGEVSEGGTEFQRPAEWSFITGRTLEVASIYGYRLPDSYADAGPLDGSGDEYVDPLADLSEDEIQRYYEAMFGEGEGIEVSIGGRQIFHADGGCIGEANHALYDDVERWVIATESVSNLILQWAPDVHSDPEFQEGVAAWRQCMLDRGYDYAEPFAALSDATSVEDQDREIAIAVADTECTEHSDLRAITLQVMERYRSVAEAARAADYAAIAEIERAALDRARQILAGQS